MGVKALFARLALVEAALNLALCFALVGPFGLAGVAVAVAVPNVLFCVFAIAYACFVLEVGHRRYLIASWLAPIGAVCVPAVLWWLVTPVEASWIGIALGIGVGLAPYVVVVAGIELAPRFALRFSLIRAAIKRASTQSAP